MPDRAAKLAAFRADPHRPWPFDPDDPWWNFDPPHPEPTAPIVVSRQVNVSAKTARAMTCVYRECLTGCQGTLCHWRASKPSPNYSAVTLGDCLKCIAATRTGRSEGHADWVAESGL